MNKRVLTNLVLLPHWRFYQSCTESAIRNLISLVIILSQERPNYCIMCVGNNTDAHPDDTDADELLVKDDELSLKFRNNMGDWSADSPPQTIQRYDTSAIPGTVMNYMSGHSIV